MPIVVFLGLSVLELDPMYATDVRQTDKRQHRLMPLPYGSLQNFIQIGRLGRSWSKHQLDDQCEAGMTVNKSHYSEKNQHQQIQ